MKLFKNIMLAGVLLAMNAMSAKSGVGQAQPNVVSQQSKVTQEKAREAEVLRQQREEQQKQQQQKMIQEKMMKAEMLQKEREWQQKQQQQTVAAEKRAQRGWFSWLWDIIEDIQVEDYKAMIEEKLKNTDKYPTLKTKKEALTCGVDEFFDSEHTNVQILQQAKEAVYQEMQKTLSRRETPDNQKINEYISKVREAFEFEMTNWNSLERNELYLNKLKANKYELFHGTIISYENPDLLRRVLLSETERLENIIGILEAKFEIMMQVLAKRLGIVERPWVQVFKNWWNGE